MDSGTALPHVIMSRTDGFARSSGLKSLKEEGRALLTEEKVDKSALERCGAVSYAMRLFTMQLFSYLQFSLGKTSVYTLDADKLLGRNAIKQLQCTTFALSLVLESLSYEAAQPLRIERFVGMRSRVRELKEGEITLRSSLTSAEVRLFSEEYRPLVYKAVALPLGSIGG